MTRRPLNPEDRKAFDRWSAAVAVFYLAVVGGLIVAILIFPRAPDVEKASSPVGNLASGRLTSGDRHP
jgi:hypothetical protein